MNLPMNPSGGNGQLFTLVAIHPVLATRTLTMQKIVIRIVYILRGVQQAVVIMLLIGRSRLVVGMTRKPPDHGRRPLAHRAMTGEGMAQFVDT